MSTETITLSNETRLKIQSLINEINSDSQFFKIRAGQSQVITFDIELYLGVVERVFKTDGGEDRKYKRHSFSVWSWTYNRPMFFELANRHVRKALRTMLQHNCNTLEISRSGDGIFNTVYNFEPKGNRPKISKIMASQIK